MCFATRWHRLGVSDVRCKMIHDHLRHFLSEEVVRDDGMGLGLDLDWGLRT